MASRIPEDFGAAWDMSDVVLTTLNSGGKELHSNKTVLAMFSPFFKVMFFSNFKEANEDRINVQCDYVGLREILQVIHHVGRGFSNKDRRYKPEVLQNIYTAADMLDFPEIRTLCEDEMLRNVSVRMANIAHTLGLHDILMRILTKMDSSHVDAFISEENKPNLGPHLFFSKADVKFFYKKKTGFDMRIGCGYDTAIFHKNLEDLYGKFDLENSRIDLTKKWFASDVALSTKDQTGRIFHSSKAVLASVSPYFYKIFNENRGAKKCHKSAEYGEDSLLFVDADYATLKWILSIIHHVNNNAWRSWNARTNVLLYDMYLTASEDYLDIPMIRAFCCTKLVDRESMYDTFDVAVKMGIAKLKSDLVVRLHEDELRAWVQSEDKAWSYLRNGKKVIITTDSQEQVLSADDFRVLFKRLTSRL